jgi:hypothetical protein
MVERKGDVLAPEYRRSFSSFPTYSSAKNALSDAEDEFPCQLYDLSQKIG